MLGLLRLRDAPSGQLSVLFGLLLGLPHCSIGETTVQWVDHPLVLSSVGANNPLPAFFFSRVQGEGASGGAWTKWDGTKGTSNPFTPPDTSDRLIWENTQNDTRIPLLPWGEQDAWGCEQEPGTARMLQIENEYLSALIAPQFGGKIWRVYDKRLKRELFLNNRANQPVNFAIRKAWTSGGVEFNWSPGYIGHTVFTLSPVYAAQLNTSRGPVIRVWEYDRIQSTTWQVDILLDGPTLFIHPRVENPTEKDLRGYWWTNVAVKTEPKGEERVLMPAKWNYQHDSWPHGNYVLQPSTFTGLKPPFSAAALGPWAIDSSWLGNLPYSYDFFMELCNADDAAADPTVPPHCAAVQPRSKPFAYISLADADGYTVVHGHRGLGTKFFTYGNTGAPYAMGQYLQDFMSASNLTQGEHLGNYLEEQTGRAPTQMNDFPLPAGHAEAWTEWFQATNFEPEQVRGTNYTSALKTVDEWIEGSNGVPQSRFTELEAFFASIETAAVPESAVLHRGLPWGGIEERFRKAPLSPSQFYDQEPAKEFAAADEVEAAPWREFLTWGTFSATSLDRNPASFVVSPKWEAALKASVAEHGDSWLHQLHLGVAAAERFDAPAAKAAFHKSMALRPSPTVARNLALLADTVHEAWGNYTLAWTTLAAWSDADPVKPSLAAALSREIATFGVSNPGFLGPLTEWLHKQDPSAHWQQGDPVQYAKLVIALGEGRAADAKEMIATHCWPTYMQSHGQKLAEAWFSAAYILEKVKVGRDLTPWEMREVRQRETVPPNIGYSCEGLNC